MKVITGYRTTLSQNITSTQSTIPVSSLETSDDTPHTITTADFDGSAFLVIEPGGANQEIISVSAATETPVDQFTGAVRGLAFYGSTPVTVAGNRKSHQAGSTVIMSNVHWYYDELMDLTSDETVSGIKTFEEFPLKDGVLTPTDDGQFTTKAYVDATATGTTNINRVVIAGVAGETITTGQLLYFKVSDSRWWKTDADTAATVNGVILGFAQSGGSAAAAINVLIAGEDSNQSGLTPGVLYYASNTAGAIASSAGTVTKVIGQAVTATQIILDPNFNTLPTANEKAAMLGDTGTPSNTNRFVTEEGLAASASYNILGDGSDGDVVVNSGSFSSGPITNNVLTRDAYFDNLTINSTFSLNPAGFRIFVKDTLTTVGTGTIARNGNSGGAGGAGGNAATNTPGAAGAAGAAASALATGSISGVPASFAGKAGIIGAIGKLGSGGPQNGTNGGNATAGDNGETLAQSLGTSPASSTALNSGAGGDGGATSGQTAGTGGVNAAGGGAGTATLPLLKPYVFEFAVLQFDPATAGGTGNIIAHKSSPKAPGSAGGAGGGGAGVPNQAATISGGGGGGGGGGGTGGAGGIVAIYAKTVVNAGTISALGGTGGAAGNGGNGGQAGGPSNAGGGGGGGGGMGGNGGVGGVVILVYNSLTNTGTISAAGGAGGALGTGGTGGLGNAGGGDGAVGLPGTAGLTGASGVVYQIAI